MTLEQKQLWKTTVDNEGTFNLNEAALNGVRRAHPAPTGRPSSEFEEMALSTQVQTIADLQATPLSRPHPDSTAPRCCPEPAGFAQPAEPHWRAGHPLSDEATRAKNQAQFDYRRTHKLCFPCICSQPGSRCTLADSQQPLSGCPHHVDTRPLGRDLDTP